MKDDNVTGAGLALVFSSLGFVIAVYEIFALGSPVAHTPIAWTMAGLTLSAIFLSAYMFYSKHASFALLAIICVVIAGILGITVGLVYLLACMVLAFIGCVVELI